MKYQNNEIFQMMRRQEPKGSYFTDDIVRNWYAARRYVLDHFDKWIGGKISPDSSNSLKIVIDGSSPLVYSVIRQIALMAHFPNFNEGKRENYSTITILYPQEYEIKDLEAEIDRLAKEEFLFNLINYSFYRLIDANGNSKTADKWLPFLDIEFMLVATINYKIKEGEIYISENEIQNAIGNNVTQSFSDNELTAAMLVNKAYSTGDEIRNLSSTENEKANRYNLALDCLNNAKQKNIKKQWDDLLQQSIDGNIEQKYKAVTKILSSIFCADTFESRLHGLMDIPNGITHKFLVSNARSIRKEIANNLLSLSKSEHARWNAEKLILGFRPLSEEESFIDEISVGKRDSFRRDLKNKFPSPSHIDIVSFIDLKRINPEDQKYDSFIMLAMPAILMQKYRPSNLPARLISHFI